MFGYSGMPGCFDVISRVLNRNLQLLLSGESVMYVDDIVGACHLQEVSHDLRQTRTLCEGVLGPDTINPKKTESGRSVDVIGWNVDLDLRKIGIARKNMLKTLHGLVEINETKPISLKELQKVASWAARYSMICRQLKPYTRTLFCGIRKYKNPHIRLKLSLEAQLTLQLWKCFFVVLETKPTRYARDITSFSDVPPKYTIEYDASLTGVGVVIYQIDENRLEQEWKVIQYEFDFNLEGKSKYQNTVEFIALVLGVAGLVSLGINNASILCRGDNKSSLSWGLSENFKSQLGRRAALVLTTLSIYSNIHIIEVVHIAGKNNVRCDQLSREKVTPSDLGFSKEQILQAGLFTKISSFCNPTVLDNTAETLIETWRTLREITSDFFPNM